MARILVIDDDAKTKILETLFPTRIDGSPSTLKEKPR